MGFFFFIRLTENIVPLPFRKNTLINYKVQTHVVLRFKLGFLFSLVCFAHLDFIQCNRQPC